MKVVLRPEVKGKGVVFVAGSSNGTPQITLADGRTITATRGDKLGATFKNPEGMNEYQWIFKGLESEDLYSDKFSLSFGDEKVDGLTLQRGNELRTENGGLQGLDPAPNKAFRGGGGSRGSLPGTPYGGGFDNAGNAVPTFTDPSGLSADTINPQYATIPPYKPIDPRIFNQVYAEYNRQEMFRNFADAQFAALASLQTEIEANQRFAPAQSALQQSLAMQENQFNRGEIQTANQFNPTQVSQANVTNRSELEAAIEGSGLPVRELVSEGLKTGGELAKGFLPTTLEDRAFEIAARSRGADAFTSKGLGSSTFTRDAIDKYTIGERLGLMQQGNQDVDRWLSKGAALLIDSPIKYNPLLNQPNTGRVSQDIRGLPTVSPQQVAQSQQGILNQGTTMTPAQAMNFAVNQDQFKTNVDLDLAKFNSNLNFNAQNANVTNKLNVDLTKLEVQLKNATLAYTYGAEAAAQAQRQYQTQQALQLQQTAMQGSQSPYQQLGNPGVYRQ